MSLSITLASQLAAATVVVVAASTAESPSPPLAVDSPAPPLFPQEDEEEEGEESADDGEAEVGRGRADVEEADEDAVDVLEGEGSCCWCDWCCCSCCCCWQNSGRGCTRPSLYTFRMASHTNLDEEVKLMNWRNTTLLQEHGSSFLPVLAGRLDHAGPLISHLPGEV